MGSIFYIKNTGKRNILKSKYMERQYVNKLENSI